MLQKPEYLATECAESFKDRSVVEAYRHRPPYPAEIFEILVELMKGEPRRVLDVGCGRGDVARNLVERVDGIDAVDFSEYMIEKGKSLLNGNHPGLHWLHGRVEEVTLNPPYALVTAGESVHWMDWNIVLPRFRDVLVPGGYLALVQRNTLPDPWFETLKEIIPRYSTNPKYQPYDMLEAWERHGLFHKVGERNTAPIPFMQSIEDYIEHYHSRSSFSRERMGPENAAAFDQEARRILEDVSNDGMLSLQVVGHIVWGNPGHQVAR